MKIKTLSALSLVFGLAFTAAAADAGKLPPAATKPGVLFAADIQPIFEKSCVKCHGPERAKARLRLDTLAGVLKGSEDGKVVEPGKSDKSDLVFSVAHVGDPDMFMPPTKGKGKSVPLTPEQVGLIRAWIDQGAK